MSRLSALFLFLCIALVAHTANAAVLVASVDRSRLYEGESFELILETTDVTQFGKPDLAPLRAQFEVRDTRQVNQLGSLSNDTRSTTRWIITLLPLDRGSLTIPSLSLGDLRSQPIVVQVLRGEATSNRAMSPVFIDASLDDDSVYVQAQAILTLRIYHSVSLYDDSSLTPLQIPDARIEQLGDTRTYEKLINGVRHGVIETRYAIYPQRSGELSIPSLTFSATPVETDADGNTHPGRLTRVTSGRIPLNVKPKPAMYPPEAAWLPARSLTLSETWNPEGDQGQVGDALTRTLTLKADGLSSAQLPPLPSSDVRGLRRYPDQPQLNNQNTERGLIGSRQEREALVPSKAGTLELPAIEVVWWNTREEHIEHTSLAARTLHVNESPSLAVETPAGSDAPVSNAAQPLLWPWQLSSFVLLCTSLAGFGLWWHARRQPAIQRAAQNGPSPRTLLDDLKRASLANDPHATRQALDAWARQQPETLAEMAARFVPLSDALDGLNGALYSEAGQRWQGADLWRAISTIPAAEQSAVSMADSLPPLYPK